MTNAYMTKQEQPLIFPYSPLFVSPFSFKILAVTDFTKNHEKQLYGATSLSKYLKM